MKIGKVPMGSLLGRLPLPGKKKGEIAPSGSSTPEPSQGNSGKKKKRRKLKLWMKIIIVLLLVAAVLAEKYHCDAVLATKCVVLSTILSMLTIPLWCMLILRI